MAQTTKRSVDEEDLHFYFKYFNHEATDGKQPTDSEEDEDKWGYTGCAEMLKTGRGASFARCCIFLNSKKMKIQKKVAKIIDPTFL